MAQKYLPRIKMGTAKNMAKSLLSTKSGKKVSDTKLKEFLKKDKDLQKYAYSSKGTSLSKSQAKKFLNKVVTQGKSSSELKISMIAKRMGIKDKGDTVSNISMESAYKKATAEELGAVPEPTGPTPEEMRREKRKEKMLKTIHKRDRAEEISKEAKQDNKQSEQSNTDAKKSGQAPSRVGGSVLTSQSKSDNNQTATPSQTPIKKNSPDSTKVGVLIFPLENKSVNIDNLKPIILRIDKLIKQSLANIGGLNIIPETEIKTALSQEKLATLALPMDRHAIDSLIKALKVRLYVIGSVSQQGPTIIIQAKLHSIDSQKEITLLNVTGDAANIFDLERKSQWQITNSLRGDTSLENKDTTNQQDIQELQI